MLSINATLLVQLIQFLILTFILNRLMFRPILKIIRDRSEHIDAGKKEIENLELKTQELANEYLSIERDARKQAHKERARVKMDAVTSAGELYNAAKNKVTSMRQEIDMEVEQEVQKVRPFLQREAEALVDEITEKMIGIGTEA
ncbi:MAG: hypothetical protein U9N82_11490 [Thermodesulfobacteriota bacterium]|nr:hypothetical protein [Thermodesulfobacteriota bacterium]